MPKSWEDAGDVFFGYISPAMVLVIVLALSILEYGFNVHDLRDWVGFGLVAGFTSWAVGICWYSTYQWLEAKEAI